MTTRISVSSNIESVIDSVDDVKDDIPKELEKRVGAAMRVLWADVKQYVLQDPNARGWLFRSIEQEQDIGDDELHFSVQSGGRTTDYAGVVEFGSGTLRETPWPGGSGYGNPPEQYPPDYPYDSPSFNIPDDASEMIRAWSSTHNTDYDTFFAIARIIEQWMRNKGMTPYTGDYAVSAMFITKEIVISGTYAHPYMRPAWFDNELKIKKAAINAVKNVAR
jgi:HK97 gp10 family phage protein